MAANHMPGGAFLRVRNPDRPERTCGKQSKRDSPTPQGSTSSPRLQLNWTLAEAGSGAILPDTLEASWCLNLGRGGAGHGHLTWPMTIVERSSCHLTRQGHSGMPQESLACFLKLCFLPKMILQSPQCHWHREQIEIQ